jgi:hypothetical protein
LIVKPDFSDASLHNINSFELTHNYINLSEVFQCYRICEDTLVSFWNNYDDHKCGVYTGLTSALFSWDWHWTASMDPTHSLCPASGRFVYFTSGGGDDDGIAVVDLI